MNTKLFLLIGTSLSLIPTLTFAQCVATQDCETLGYTETSCNGGKGVKCPFGNKWACLPTKESICKEEGFTLACNETGQIGGGDSCNGLYKQCSCDSSYQYTCSGTGYSGGSGTACGGKYAACNCSSGYEWKDGSCQQKITDGVHGDLYYCGGVVVAVKSPGMSFFVAMKDLGQMNFRNAYSSCQNYSFCSNLKGILPSKDQLLTMYNNKSSLNSLLSANGGANLTEDWYWSSTGRNASNPYCFVYMSSGSVGCAGYSTYLYYTRPILTSW